MEFIVNEEAYNQLPADLQKIVEVAARAVNQDMLDEYTARNNAALQSLLNDHGVELKQLPDDVLAMLKQATQEVLAEQAAADESFAKVYAAYSKFQKEVANFHAITEARLYQTRD